MLGRIIAVLLATCCSLLLASCATMSPEECKVADWHEVGQRDGINGQALTHLQSRIEDCAKVGVSVNAQAYRAGRDLGLRSYCRLENAVPLGLNGGYYAGVCPPAIDGPFQQRFQLARSVYDLRNEVNTLDNRIESLERRLRESNHEEEKRLKEARTDEERRKLRKSIDDDRREIRNELSETDRRLRRKRDELRSAEYALSNVR